MLPRIGAIAFLGLVLPVLASPTLVRGATHTVEIGDGFFAPASLTVAVGDTVTWTNTDDSPHTVSSGAFDSGNLNAGQRFSFTFTEAGTFGYVCNYHDEMTATVTVAEAIAPAAASPVASAAAAPAASSTSHDAAAHSGQQPDTALPEPAGETVAAWIAPMLIGVGLVALAVGVLPQRAAAATSASRQAPQTGGWRR
jgi:plastocyanin